VCSGIEAATVAWHPLGWKPSFFSEIEAAPRSVLAHHYPDVPLHGDFTTISGDEYEPIELLVGGTPCQSFSIAGLRSGLDDERGNLALEFFKLAQRTRPRWLVWENVPGVLSSNGGRDFGSILGAMVELGYGFAYRVLDAQYFGVAQRRRRVFVVGYLGDWRPAAAVLFERHSLQGHSAPSREKGEEIAGTLAGSTYNGGAGGKPEGAAVNHFIPEVAKCLTRGTAQRYDFETDTFVTFLGGIDCENNGHYQDQPTGPLMKGSPSGGGKPLPAVAFDLRGRDGGSQFEGPHNTVNIRAASGGSSRSYVISRCVRRLTPRECERLQGFPDDYTLVPHRNKPMADGPRYKALGNSMAVPVMRWIGERIQVVEDLKC
jgi:DNA (cytosine-5)-methyltransferase 1